MRFPSRPDPVRDGGTSAEEPERTLQPDLPAPEVRLLAVEKDERTVRLRLDDGRLLELAPQAVPDQLPGVGQIVPASLLAALTEGAARKLAARRLLALLDRRLLPEARLRRVLEQEGHPPQAVASVLQDMRAQGLCSDRKFAEAYCRDCLRTKAVGRRYLVAKLREKEVPAAVAAEVAAEFLSPDQERELALRAARQRWTADKSSRESPRDPQAQARAQARAQAKITRFLVGRGFDPATAGRAARDTRPDRRRQPGPEDA